MKTNKPRSDLNLAAAPPPAGFHFRRRDFLRTSAALAAATTLPRWFLDESGAQAATTKPLSPNDQPAVALIGCGGMGKGDAKNAARFGRIVAVCDLDETRLAEAKKLWPEAATYKDFRRVMEREDIHVVICATVDHWHTLVSLAALRAGKDVYCEKPLTLTIDEGKRLVKAAAETTRILQTGSQQRSDKNFRLVCELVRNGRLGKIKQAQVFLPAGLRGGPFASGPAPEGLDWDFWKGPTPDVGYVKERCHFSFRYWWDYSGGTMTDWGAHHNDIVLWALGFERSAPVTIEGKALVEMIPGGFTATSEYRVEYAYSNGVRHICQSTRDDSTSGGVVNKDGQRHGIKFEGANGWLWVTRGAIQASDPEFLTQPLPANALRLQASDDHMGNFFDCVRSRKQPICDVEIGHRSASVCHLGTIAIRLGRKLNWDNHSQRFWKDDEANQHVARAMRKPWDYDAL